MTKFSGTKRCPLRPNLTAPIKTLRQRALTYEGGQAFVRDAESELFLLAVTNMVSEDTFYEDASDRDARFAALVGRLAVSDPEWTARTSGLISLSSWIVSMPGTLEPL